FTTKLLVPGAGYLCQRLVQLMHCAAIASWPRVVVVTAPGEAAGPPGVLWPPGMTEGPVVALAAPDVLAIADTVAVTVQAAVATVQAVQAGEGAALAGAPPGGHAS